MNRDAESSQNPIAEIDDEAPWDLEISWDAGVDAEAMARRAESLRKRSEFGLAAEDRVRTLLLVIDAQKDFCLPEGALFVAGRDGRAAVDDTTRLVRFIHTHLAELTAIDCTLDTHQAHQIFFAPFWQQSDGEAPSPFQQIGAGDIERGAVLPRRELAALLGLPDLEWLRRHVLHYARSLEDSGRHRLTLWPLHCLLGSPGHDLVPALQEARLLHSWARFADNRLEIKGLDPLTESYSVLGPEVQTAHDGRPLTPKNEAYLERLFGFERILVAGQAASHCVRFSITDLLEQADERGVDVAPRLVLLEDCMSSVTVRDPSGELVVDHTPEVEGWLDDMRASGAQVATSNDDLFD